MGDNMYREFNSPTDKEKCNYYNRTRNRLLITAYEGIPENLLLNALGCLVSKVLCKCNILVSWNIISNLLSIF